MITVFRLGLLILFLIYLSSCNISHLPAWQTLSGRTMGGYFFVQLEVNDQHVIDEIERDINQLLVALNDAMSTYIPSSELSKINRSVGGQWMAISTDLFMVLCEASYLSKISAGAFDITVGPLVNLWGFGPEKTDYRLPTPDEIKRSQKYVGYQDLSLQANPPRLKKTFDLIYIDLSSIAKGYAVDKISSYLLSQNIDNFLVEIGGEIMAHGQRPNGGAWRVGLEEPVANQRRVGQVVGLHDMGLATSGDYRNFFEIDGRRYSHTVDPLSGYPVDHQLVSVTVFDESVMRADGLATAMLVMGPKRGLVFAKSYNITARFVIRTGEQFMACRTDGSPAAVAIALEKLPICH